MRSSAEVKANNFEADPSALILVTMCVRADAIFMFWITTVLGARELGDGVNIDLADVPTFYDEEVA